MLSCSLVLPLLHSKRGMEEREPNWFLRFLRDASRVCVRYDPILRAFSWGLGESYRTLPEIIIYICIMYSLSECGSPTWTSVSCALTVFFSSGWWGGVGVMWYHWVFSGWWGGVGVMWYHWVFSGWWGGGGVMWYHWVFSGWWGGGGVTYSRSLFGGWVEGGAEPLSSRICIKILQLFFLLLWSVLWLNERIKAFTWT